MKEPIALTCWTVSDGSAGNERQAETLAAALAFPALNLRIRLREPWNFFAPRLIFLARQAIRDEAGRPLSAPWPALAIGCGRRAALATRALRRWSGGRTFTVQILDPRIDPALFDLVIAPRHDGISGPNVLQTIGALNPVDADWLAAGRAAFPALAGLPAPRTAVLIGGSNRAQRLDAAYFAALLEGLRARQAIDGCSFLVSVSRRTPLDDAERLRRAFASMPGVFWSGAHDGANPYAGFLGWSDRIVVTPDSVNMISEAAATGKPLFTFAPRAIRGKIGEFHRALRDSGRLAMLGEPIAMHPSPLAETAEVAALVRARWLAHVQCAPNAATGI